MNFCHAVAFAGLSICADSDIRANPIALENSNIHAKFLEHSSKHGLSFKTKEEHDRRLKNFAITDELIEKSNADKRNTYVLEHNKFSTADQEELDLINGGDEPLPTKDLQNLQMSFNFPTASPQSVDWRRSGAINPVMDQGECGSCWAFAATTTVEAAWKIKTGQLLKLSEMQLVNCETKFSKGCNNGNPATAYMYLNQYPQMLAAHYPYYPQDGPCRYNPQLGQVRVMNHQDIQP